MSETLSLEALADKVLQRNRRRNTGGTEPKNSGTESGTEPEPAPLDSPAKSDAGQPIKPGKIEPGQCAYCSLRDDGKLGLIVDMTQNGNPWWHGDCYDKHLRARGEYVE